jgi:ATP-binding cassette subfamily E protein 1
MLDEPSAHLDVEQRALATSLIRRFTENKKVGTLLVDHDIYMIDLASERLMVFTGDPGVRGAAEGPFDMHEGMNRFLKDIGITFRRDQDTHRPRVNKIASKLDRQQREDGEYYYPE